MYFLMIMMRMTTTMMMKKKRKKKKKKMINQINRSNFYSASIPGEARFGGMTAESVFKSKIKEKVP